MDSLRSGCFPMFSFRRRGRKTHVDEDAEVYEVSPCLDTQRQLIITADKPKLSLWKAVKSFFLRRAKPSHNLYVHEVSIFDVPFDDEVADAIGDVSAEFMASTLTTYSSQLSLPDLPTDLEDLTPEEIESELDTLSIYSLTEKESEKESEPDTLSICSTVSSVWDSDEEDN